MTTFYVLKDLDTGEYMPNPLGRGGRGGTHQELVPAGSGIPPRLYASRGAALNSLRWWARGVTTVSVTFSSNPFEGDECDESWHTEPVPERRLRRMNAQPVEVAV